MFEPMSDPWEYAQSRNLLCPVCQKFLGFRSDNIKSDRAHCDECKATFIYEKDKEIPFKSIMDTKPKKGCTCQSCLERNQSI